ncbi:hypothetical protein [Methanoregula sp.]|jgi:hypothetical protein|uniref:hypothetical protein n=1 Tax=Methanoregula sp. TaxID=2052170 RepID=UPI003C1659A4
MRPTYLILLLVLIASFGAGCVSKAPNPSVRVTGTDIEDITPVQVGDFDVYTANFRIENPTNKTFNNVDVRFNLIPATIYCHTQTQDVMIPSVAPLERKTERFSFSEFADLNCEYTYTFEVTSDTENTFF